ncbi:hypothetical protein CFE_2221 [Carboxydocella thermautotrophica]|uniref:Uncharacterized protein n=1 Tax=Carboxydocella thermautotrophica TaxID=178899 RepID=A0A2R4N2P6_CARTR|nr:hypothetical protein CFE_2221 [Carboxydocella thermautotrophica]AVX31862.1 hypothetical protein CTH_2323 [Carboxydocella thermautotrophica]
MRLVKVVASTHRENLAQKVLSGGIVHKLIVKKVS